MTQRHLGGPRRVVYLHRHERQVEVARQALRFAEMKRLRMRLERVVRPGDRDALLADLLDLLGPRIDERHVVAGPREKRTDVASDGSGADEQDLLGHVALPVVMRMPGIIALLRTRAPVPSGRLQLEERGEASPAAGEVAGGTFLDDAPALENDHPVGLGGG